MNFQFEELRNKTCAITGGSGVIGLSDRQCPR
jgi:hypothetical protein